MECYGRVPNLPCRYDDDGVEGDDDWAGRMFDENFGAYLRTIYFCQVGAHLLYVLYRVAALASTSLGFTIAPRSPIPTQLDVHLGPFGGLKRDTSSKTGEYMMTRHELLTGGEPWNSGR